MLVFLVLHGPMTHGTMDGKLARLGPLADDRSLHRKDKLLVCARDADRRESPICTCSSSTSEIQQEQPQLS